MARARATLFLPRERSRMETKLERIARMAKEDPQKVFTSLAHLMNQDWLKQSFSKLRRKAAPGIDHRSYSDYGENLEENIEDLYQRLKSGRYKAPNIRRAWIPKGSGDEKRPLGISTIEDKIVQRAVSDILTVIYEQDFNESSYGFRKGRSAHQALSSIWQNGMKHRYRWIIDADIKKCFDSFDHRVLVDILKKRVNDGSLLRLIYQWMKAGVIDGNQMFKPESGVPQGNIISPLLSNIYLHEVLDKWLEEIRPLLKGRMYFVRYADDYVIGFENEGDARKVYRTMFKRFAKYGLTIHPDKTRLLNFRPGNKRGERTFTFLGFTHFWGKSKAGNNVIRRKVRKEKVNYMIKELYSYCKRNRHRRLKEQWQGLCRKLNGYYQYFAIWGNIKGMICIRFRATRHWLKWLNRRSQRNSYNWTEFNMLLKNFPLPYPKLKDA